MLSIMDMMKSLYASLDNEAARLLRHLQRILSSEPLEVWLVGGTIRDLLEGLPPKDFDFAFKGDLTPFASIWAQQEGGHWFWLDKARNQSRVLFSESGLQFDFSPLRAADIQADLSLRDFTLNAIALPFIDFPTVGGELLDPLDGRKDLRAGTLRSCGPGVLKDDPLRILKGVRHHALRGWQVEAQTVRQMTVAAPLLLEVAGERLRNELGQILGSKRLASAFALMEKTSLLDHLFPDILKQDLAAELELVTRRCDQLEQVPTFARLLGQPIEEGVSRRSLLLLAALLCRVPRLGIVEQMALRLRLSVRSRSILQTICARQIGLVDFNDLVAPRVAALKLESLGRNSVELLLFTLARRDGKSQDLLFAEYCSAYLQQLNSGRIIDLLDGGEIVRISGLPAGPLIGDIQQRIKAAEIAGEISTRADAESWLQRQFSD